MTSRLVHSWPLWALCVLIIASQAIVGTTSLPPAGDDIEVRWDPTPALAPMPATTPEQGTSMLSRQPVAFVANLGQWDGRFTHKARMGPMTVFLQERGWTFTLAESKEKVRDPDDPRIDREMPVIESGRSVAVRMHFANGAAAATPIDEDRLPGVHNYFLGSDPTRWQSDVPLHGAVRLQGLYPAIDLRARSDSGHFEYDLLVEPGADLAQVLVTVAGADGLHLDPDGTLVIDTALGPVRQALPKSWQVDGFGQHQEVACKYVLHGASSFGFEAPGRDRDLALVVDPGLVFSTYLGGSDLDEARAIALGATAVVTVCGRTDTQNFPTTAGAFDVTCIAGDAFVTRLDPSGSTLVYSTFLGGSAPDFPWALAVDAAGVATVCGSTWSMDFPATAGAFGTIPAGGLDAFVTRLSPSGSALLYSTFLGGSNDDLAHTLTLDATGATTIGGSTWSTDFPVTAGGFDTTHNGGWDAFVTRLDPAGSALAYSTYLGGTDDDKALALALDATGAAIVGGITYSTNFPSTAGSFDTSHNGDQDAFVARFDPAGSTLIYSTYLGGTGFDHLGALALDATGSATVCGYTMSANFPTSAGAFDTTFNGGILDAFVTRLDLWGSALVYSTYLGGAISDIASTLALDTTGAATVGGGTASSDFPTTPGALDTTFNGGLGDAFVTRLSPSGSTLVYSTYLGGSSGDSAAALALDATGAATVFGNTESANFPTTPGAFDTTFNGGTLAGDTFVTRLDLGTTIGISQPGGPGTPITIDNAYLTPGNEYYNIFSLDLCPAGPGTGPYLGLCATTLPNAQFILLQASLPVGSPPFHFIAPASSVSWGPYAIGPGTLDALCLDVTGGVLGTYSPVTRITIQ